MFSSRCSYSILLTKHERIPKGQPRMDNLETLTTLGTQDTGRKHNTTQKTKKMTNIESFEKPDVPAA